MLCKNGFLITKKNTKYKKYLIYFEFYVFGTNVLKKINK